MHRLYPPARAGAFHMVAFYYALLYINQKPVRIIRADSAVCSTEASLLMRTFLLTSNRFLPILSTFDPGF
jgi:hypothetical protein